MRINNIKLITTVLFALPLLWVTAFTATPKMTAANTDDDAATMYTKYLCSACHTKTASKNFDATKSDADLVQIVLKGKKAEKPPNMPSFETTKQMTEAQAQALVTYMKGLKTAPPAN
jgi:mono/diheme cytochrome c family protein